MTVGRVKRYAAIAAVVSAAAILALGVFATTRHSSASNGVEISLVRELKPKHLASNFLFKDGVGKELAWSSDGKKIAAYTEFGSVVTIWSIDGEVIKEFHRPWANALALAFVDHDRDLVVAAGCNVSPRPPCYTAFSVVDAETGKVLREIAGPHPEADQHHNPDASNVAYILVASPDESVLAVVAGRAMPAPVTFYSTETWEQIGVFPDMPASNLGPAAIAFSPNGELVALGTHDGTVTIYDLKHGQIRVRIRAFMDLLGPGLSWLAFNHDATIVAIGGSGSRNAALYDRDGTAHTQIPERPIRLFRVSDGAPLDSYPMEVADIESGTWRPDDRFIAFTALFDKTLYLWDMTRPEEPAGEFKLSDILMNVAFSPVGDVMALSAGPKIALLRISKQPSEP